MSDTVERRAAPRSEQSPPIEPIPVFETEEEAREFWATHDSAPYFDQMEDMIASPPIDLDVGGGRAGSTTRRRPPEGRMDLVSIRIPVEMIEAVKEIAAGRHLPYQTLMRSWIAERVAQERRALRHERSSGT